MNQFQSQVLNNRDFHEALEKEAELARDLRENGLGEGRFRRGAAYFGVSRSLPDIGNSARELAEAVDAALAGWQRPDDDCRALLATTDCVDDLASRFRTITGRFSVSAASKMLWLVQGAPFRVYDNRAKEGLAKITGGPARADYCTFLRDWESAYSERGTEVRSAVEAVGLAAMPEWQALPVPSGNTREEDLSARVFDKWLFIKGGG